LRFLQFLDTVSWVTGGCPWFGTWKTCTTYP